MVCPNKSSEEWIALESIYGEEGAMAIFVNGGYELPSLEAIGLISDTKPMSSIRESSNYNKINIAFVDNLKRSFPNINIVEAYFEDARAGWVEKGNVYINLNKSDENTYVHELAHVVEFLIEQESPEMYEEMINLVHKVDPTTYREMSELYYEDGPKTWASEALMLGVERVRQTKTVNTLYLHLMEFGERLFNMVGLSTKLKGIIKYRRFLLDIVDKLESGSNISSEQLRELGMEIRNKKVKSVNDVNSFIEAVSGIGLNTPNSVIKKKIDWMLSDPKFQVLDSSGNIVGVKFKAESESKGLLAKLTKTKTPVYKFNNSKTKEENIEDLIRWYRDLTSKEIDDEVNNILKDFIIPEDVEEPSSPDEVKLPGDNYPDLFLDYRENDKILKYSSLKDDDALSHLYHPEFDIPGLIVKIRETDSRYVLDYVMVSNQSIKPYRKSSRFIGNLGIGNKIFGGKLSNIIAGKALGINHSADFKNAATFFLTALSSVTSKYSTSSKAVEVRGLKLTNAKFISSEGKGGTFNISLVTGVDLLNKVLNLSLVKDILAGTTLEQKLYENGKPNKNISTKGLRYNLLKDLSDIKLHSLKWDMTKKLKQAADKFSSQVEGTTEYYSSLAELKEFIAQTIQHNYNEKEDLVKLATNQEYVALLEIWAFLDDVNKELNPYKETGMVEHFVNSMKEMDNPYVSWWMKAWDNAKYKIKEGFMSYSKERDKLFDEYIKYVDAENVAAKVGTRFIDNPMLYYDRLFIKDSDGKNTYRLKDESDLANDLERRVVKYFKKEVKEMLKISFMIKERLSEEDQVDEQAFETWYNQSVFSRGYIPLVSGSVSTLIFSAGAGNVFENIFQRMTDFNAEFEFEAMDTNKIPDYLLSQFSEDSYSAKLDKDNNEDKEGVQTSKLHGGPELDLRKVLDIFKLNSLRLKNNNRLIPIYKAARVLIASNDFAYGITNLEENSRDAEVLEAIYEYTVFGKKGLISKRSDELGAVLNKALQFTSTFTTYMAIGASPITDIKTFIQGVVRTLAVAMSNNGVEYSLTDLGKTAFEWVTKPGESLFKATELGEKLGLINTDTHDFLTNRYRTGEKFSLLDKRNAFFFQRVGDNFIKMLIMHAMMKKDNTWDSWEVQGKGKDAKVVYNKQKDIANRGKAIVDAVHDSIMKEYNSTKYLDTSHDGNMRRTYEKRIADVLGGFSEGMNTKLGTSIVGNHIIKFKKHLPMRVSKAIKGEVYSHQEGDWGLDENGQAIWMNKLDTGTIETFFKALAMLSSIASKDLDWSNLTDTDRQNIRKLASFMFWFFVVFAFKTAVEDDEEENKTFNKIADTVIQDMLISDQMYSGLSLLKGEFLSVFYTLKMGKAILTWDTNSLTKQIGILRSIDTFMPESSE